jgi:hypothetical protein
MAFKRGTQALKLKVDLMTENEVVHETPAWYDKADFIIGADVDGGSSALTREQLWAKKVDESTFMICCIPFFLYDLALGDVVTTKTSQSFTYMVDRLVQSAGRYTFRAWFLDKNYREAVAEHLVGMGCLIEWRFCGGNLLAIDSESYATAKPVADYLFGKQKDGILNYETGLMTDRK